MEPYRFIPEFRQLFKLNEDELHIFVMQTKATTKEKAIIEYESGQTAKEKKRK